MTTAAVIQPATGMNSQYSGKNAQHYRVRKSQDEHRDQSNMREREPAKNYLRADVVLQHQRAIRPLAIALLRDFLSRRHEMNDLVGKILAVAQEKDCAGESESPKLPAGAAAREPFDVRRAERFDIRAMALEEDSDLGGLLVGPSEVLSDVV